METSDNILITVEATVHASLEKVWDCWSLPEHIMRWYHASDDWFVPDALNELRTGGKFKTTMAARDGSMSFDFEGTYTQVQQHKTIGYTIVDGRKVSISFTEVAEGIRVTEAFEAETTNPAEMQQHGWQAILDNFRKHTETTL